MKNDLTHGSISRALILFALPMIAGNLLQQLYNIADTLIVGRYIGAEALAAVGSAYTLMTFITSVIIGLCMGCGAIFAVDYGAGRNARMRENAWMSFFVIAGITVFMYVLLYTFLDAILNLLQIPSEVRSFMREYTFIVFIGLGFVFIYNYFSYYLRAMGMATVPLYFLVISSFLNIALDFLFVIYFERGIKGAAEATVISQAFAGLGLMFSALPENFPKAEERHFSPRAIFEIIKTAGFTSIQQSVMNFGILMIQALVNSFGAVIMAAFAVAVKIDTLAYMPSQEFGNAYSMFVSQNFGAGERERVKYGTKLALLLSGGFCMLSSAVVFVFASPLMSVFLEVGERAIISAGVRYLHIEGACYIGIGLLFLLYGYFRGIKHAEVSLLLTVISLGTRVVLAYALAPYFGVIFIWWSIPIGWLLADIAGFIMMNKNKRINKVFSGNTK